MGYADLHEHLKRLEGGGAPAPHQPDDQRLAVEGRYYETGEKLKSRHVKASDVEND